MMIDQEKYVTLDWMCDQEVLFMMIGDYAPDIIVVKAHDGHNWVESGGRSKVSTFSFSLPVQAD